MNETKQKCKYDCFASLLAHFAEVQSPKHRMLQSIRMSAITGQW
ncbi:hypothetical protein RR11_3431 [Ruegeria sp. R11]|nr:hypothetical protein RR11_3431 [Ruegeria sp. R11]